MSAKQFDVNSLPLSASVKGSISVIDADQEIPAWQVAWGILQLHKEYAGRLGEKLSAGTGPSFKNVRTVEEWFMMLAELFNLELLRQQVEWLDGRLTIWGLAQLDAEMKAYLDSFGFLYLLEEEYFDVASVYPGDLTKTPTARSVRPENLPDLYAPEDPSDQVAMMHRGVKLCVAKTAKGWRLPADAFLLRAGIGNKVVAGSIYDELQQDIERPARSQVTDFLRDFMNSNEPPTTVRPLSVNLDESLAKKVLPFTPTGTACLIIAAYETMQTATLAEVRPVIRGIVNAAQARNVSHLVMPNLISRTKPAQERVEKARYMLDALLEITEFGSLKTITLVTTSPQLLEMARQRLDLRENNLSQALSNDQADGDDMLNISAEIYALADTLLLHEVRAPLAVGIMGGWGSGKSFVMHLLKQRMANIRARRVLKGWPPFSGDAPRSPFVGHIYQVTFNAWTYAKSNLWASLMHTIFFELNRQLSLEKVLSRGSVEALLAGGDVYKNLYREDYQLPPESYSQAGDVMDNNLLWLTMRSQKKTELEKLNALETQIASQRSSRETASKARLEKVQAEIGSQAQFAASEILKKKATALAENIIDSDGKLLLSQAKLDVGQVETLLASLRSLRTTWGYISSVVKKSWTNMALALLLAIFLAGSLVTNLPSVAELLKLDWLSRLTAQLGALVALALPIIRLADSWSTRVKEIVQEYQASVDTELENWQSTRDIRLAEQQAQDEAAVQEIIGAPGLSLQAKRAALQNLAATNVTANDKLVEMLQSEAEEQRRKVGPTAHYLTLLEFVRSRLADDSYEKQLGLMHQVKQDFDELTASLMRDDDGTQELFPRGEPRIVLFIDDLDRCPPLRVVEVLEAVQLLLNTKLFVIVMGLDTRYVTRALEKEYKEILQHEGDPSGLDYIEKIIQIPYRVRPMEPGGLQNFLQKQMQIENTASKPRPGSDPAAETPKGEPKSTSDGLAAPAPGEAPVGDNSQKTVDVSQGVSPETPTNVPPIEFSAEVVKFQQDDLTDLALCCQQVDLTPRSVKRLVNVLKLIKIFWFRSLGGDRTRPVKQSVMSLLALSAAYPEIMREIFIEMDSYFKGGNVLREEAVISQLKTIRLRSAIETSFAWQLVLFRRDVDVLQAQKFGLVTIAELDQTTLNIVRSFSFVGDPSYWTDQKPEPAPRPAESASTEKGIDVSQSAAQ